MICYEKIVKCTIDIANINLTFDMVSFELAQVEKKLWIAWVMPSMSGNIETIGIRHSVSPIMKVWITANVSVTDEDEDAGESKSKPKRKNSVWSTWHWMNFHMIVNLTLLWFLRKIVNSESCAFSHEQLRRKSGRRKDEVGDKEIIRKADDDGW